jgi:hypothetical protein
MNVLSFLVRRRLSTFLELLHKFLLEPGDLSLHLVLMGLAHGVQSSKGGLSKVIGN